MCWHRVFLLATVYKLVYYLADRLAAPPSRVCSIESQGGKMHSSAAKFKPSLHQLLATIFIIATVIAFSATMFGQAYFGTVSGELTDATGAVVEGAKVVLVDQQKGYNFTATSDSSGRYLFRSIPPGMYSVTAEAAGFGKTTSVKLKVDINQNATANLTLKIASATQTVQVSAEAQAIQTNDAETGQVVNRRFINDLPLIDRNVIELVNLAPGITAMDDQCDVTCTGTNFVSNGSRGAQADILTDGASVTNAEPNGGITAATYLPSPEAVEEFKVEQTNFSAEYGFSGASVVNMITRSGTNAFHGSGYDFVRDAVLDANNWFANHYGQPIPPLRRNNYGFTIGGPIRKNKTFFFFDYDALRATTQSTNQAGVPSDLMRAGNFGEVCSQQGGTFDNTGRCSVDRGTTLGSVPAHLRSQCRSCALEQRRFVYSLQQPLYLRQSGQSESASQSSTSSQAWQAI